MTLSQRIDNMSDNQVKSIWDGLCAQFWDSQTMYDQETSMDEYAMIIYSEMDHRGLKK